MGICVNCKSMTIPCTQPTEALSSRYDNKPGKKKSSSTASNNPHQDSYAETSYKKQLYLDTVCRNSVDN